MIDIHSHILFDVDDGASSIKESLKMTKVASSIGYHTIVATPHYISNSKFNSDYKNNFYKLNELRNNIEANNIPIQIILGNEVYYDTDLGNNLDRKIISTINDSRYILMETPRHRVVFKNLLNFIFQLQVKGYIIILAHPERYEFVYSDPSLVVELIRRDVLLQLNLSSLIGYYGKKVQDTAYTLLDHNMIHFTASDAHNANHYKQTNLALEELKKRTDKYRYLKLVEGNAKMVLEDKIYYPEEPNEIKKRSFFSFFNRK